jgi:tetratricopeptide (TPR) repeat protein
MERYVSLQPDQPNPRDSYGEILRMAGKFDDVLKQYRASIQIDPSFGSELGVADTYTVMGKQAEAREEYERAILFAGSPGTRISYELQSAVTWIRENNLKQASRTLNDVARHAHQQGLAFWEAEAYRVLAVCNPDYKSAMKSAQFGLNALQENHPLAPSDREEEQARLLRVIAIRAAAAEDQESAAKTIEQLQTMSAASQSQVVQLATHSAKGALLLAEQKYQEAMDELEEDSSDPLSMRLLWQAYNKTGHSAKATELGEKLVAWYVPTAEQALVVPQFRGQLLSENREHP